MSLAFLNDSKRLVTADNKGTLQIWDTATSKSLQRLSESTKSLYALAPSADGKILASGGESGVVSLWNSSSGNLLRKFDVRDKIRGLAFSPDGKQLACATHGQGVLLMDAETGKVLHSLSGYSWAVSSVDFSPDGKWLATGSWDKTVKLWDVATGRQVWSKELDGWPVPVKFSPDNQSIICGANGRIVYFEAQTGKEIRSLLSRGGTTRCLLLTPDRRTLLTGGADSIKQWNNSNGRLLATMVALPNATINEAKPLTADARPLAADARPLVADARPLAADARPLVADARPLVADARPLVADARDVVSTGDYLIATPEGYYSGSAGIDRYIYFKIFNDSFPAECFQSRYHRPDLVKLALSGQQLPAVGDFKGAYPPSANFKLQNNENVAGNSATISLETGDDSAVQSVAFFVNGARVEAKATTTDARPLTSESRALTADANALTADSRPLIAESRILPAAYKVARTFSVSLPLPPDSQTIKVQAIAFDDDGLQSSRAEMVLTHTKSANAIGKLLGLCVGVSRYQDARLNLKYADADANALAADFNRQKQLYSATQVQALTNENATSKAVTTALDNLIAQTTRADTIVLSLSGHGWRDEARNFYFATHEVNRNDVAHSALPWREVIVRLTKLSEKSKRVIVLLDACHSGSAATNEEMVKAILGANAGVLVFASSRGSEVSLENAEWAHGAFTKALLEAAQGLAVPPNEKHITTIDFIAYVSRRVKALTENQQHPQVPFLQDFDTDAALLAKP